MNERVSRRFVFREILSNGIDAFTHILRGNHTKVKTSLNTDPTMTPDQAGHLLRNRKTSKKHSLLNYCGHSECDPLSDTQKD